MEHTHNASCPHTHDFSHGHEHESERKVKLAMAITGVMMVAEIFGGWWFNSMALIADGWHMATHTVALATGAFAYFYARTRADHPAYSFGTGKVHALGSFTSAVILMLVAVIVFGESAWRLAKPEVVAYGEAVSIAVVGLAVNVLSIWILRDNHHHHDGHAHTHDHNLRAAYAHVVTDALVSVLAIIALTLGYYFHWVWLDALVGIIGAVIIAQWGASLLRTTAPVLLDRQDEALVERIRGALVASGDAHIVDVHVWEVAPGRKSLIVSLASATPQSVEHYRALLTPFDLAHITVEVVKSEA